MALTDERLPLTKGPFVDVLQPIFAGVLATVLLALGLYFGARQVKALRSLKAQPNLDSRERRYARSQAWIRLMTCACMMAIAGMVSASYLLGIEQQATELGKKLVEQRQEGGEEPELTTEQKEFGNFYRWYWATVVALLAVLFFLALIDLLGIRRYARRQLRQLNADRRAMMEREVARLRSARRNGD